MNSATALHRNSKVRRGHQARLDKTHPVNIKSNLNGRPRLRIAASQLRQRVSNRSFRISTARNIKARHRHLKATRNLIVRFMVHSRQMLIRRQTGSLALSTKPHYRRLVANPSSSRRYVLS